jgi:hypothetical protein
VEPPGNEKKRKKRKKRKEKKETDPNKAANYLFWGRWEKRSCCWAVFKAKHIAAVIFPTRLYL